MEFAFKVLNSSSIKVTKQACIIHIVALTWWFLSVCSAQNLTVDTSGILDDHSEIIGMFLLNCSYSKFHSHKVLSKFVNNQYLIAIVVYHLL